MITHIRKSALADVFVAIVESVSDGDRPNVSDGDRPNVSIGDSPFVSEGLDLLTQRDCPRLTHLVCPQLTHLVCPHLTHLHLCHKSSIMSPVQPVPYILTASILNLRFSPHLLFNFLKLKRGGFFVMKMLHEGGEKLCP